MGSRSQFKHMAKRLRRLTSLLWSDEADGVELHRAWFQTEACQAALATPCAATAQMEKIQELEQDNKNLVEINQALRKQLNCSGNGTTVNLPTLPRLVVKKGKTMSGGGPGDFLNALPRDIRAHHRTQQICNDLEQSGFMPLHVSFDFDDSKLGSAILDHCELSISTLWKKFPAVFKIGITRNPAERWPYYAKDPHDKWMHMRVLAALPDSLSAGLVEAAMLYRFQATPGCRNVQRGGEGVDHTGEGPCFVYVVYRRLVPPGRA